MKYYVLIVIIMILLNTIITGVFKEQIRSAGIEIIDKEAEFAAGRTHHAFLLRTRQDLLRRDRITSHAQRNLGMVSLSPDQIARSGQIREIHEVMQRNRNITFVIVDFIPPSITANPSGR
jgi:hypothetical protein